MTIHKEGYISIFIVVAIAAAITYIPYYFLGLTTITIIIGIVLFLFSLFIISFFRVPVRTTVDGSATVAVAPADGKVVIIQEVEEPEYFQGKRLQVSIFMSFFDVHANWFPISGKVVFYKYHPGKYLAAWHPKSSTLNERTTIVVKNENGDEVLMRQIAGLCARRVVCYTNTDTDVKSGQVAGFIKFGSRADLFFPLGTEICVKMGDKVVGAETVVAKLK